MKCARCGAEAPGQAQFCMKCGAPIPLAGASRSGGAVTMARAMPAAGARGSRKPLIAGIAAALLLIAALLAGWKLLNPTSKSGRVAKGGEVVNAPAVTPTGAPLLDRAGRVNPGGPVASRTATGTPPPPAEIVDYLAFLKKVEAQKVTLIKQELGETLALSSKLPGDIALSQSGTDEAEISRNENQAFGSFQQKIAAYTSQWNDLSRFFLSKPAPQPCIQLQSKYYDMLGKTSGRMASIANSFSSALSGDPSDALKQLSAMQGTASHEIDEAAQGADDELARVCTKWGISKSFDITSEGSGPSLPGGLGGMRL